MQAQRCLMELEHNPPADDADLYHRLQGYRTELVLFMIAATQSKAVKKDISKFYNLLRKTQPMLSGQDLIDMGLTPGPVFRAILQALLDARLHGQVETREDEIRFVRRWLQNPRQALPDDNKSLDSKGLSR